MENINSIDSIDAETEELYKDMLISLRKSKKKKREKNIEKTFENENSSSYETCNNELSEDPREDLHLPYTYQELLDIIYKSLNKEKDIVPEKSKIDVFNIIKVHNVNKDTFVYNFSEIIRIFRRESVFILDYFRQELQKDVSINDKGTLIIKRNMATLGQINNIIKKFAIAYVICYSCNKRNTHLKKDPISRLLQMHCMDCKSCITVTKLVPVKQKRKEFI
jgi:translation initiation factor 2 beta subunit (eIF-2beta)/eIF-5